LLLSQYQHFSNCGNAMQNTLERIRTETGLSKPKFLNLLGATRSQLSLLIAREENVDPEYIERAKYIRNRYQQWEEKVLEKLEEYESRGFKDLTSYELQETFNLRDMHILQLRFRGKITAVRKPNSHSWHFPIKDLRSLIHHNSTVLSEETRHVRGPLSFGFLRWLGKVDSEGLDLTRDLQKKDDTDSYAKTV
jgi:hypothetical protein